MELERLFISTVSDLTATIKDVLESEFSGVMVEGEVSQPTVSANGHLYFTLKDDKAQIACVMWRTARNHQNISLSHGQQVVVGGDIQVYAPQGKYQLICATIKQAGVGALQQAFEKLKIKLQAEGLFDSAHKKPLPRFPKRIGLITSESGAAYHDITSTLQKRYPLATLVFKHASVQGVSAASEITSAIAHLAEHGNVDVLIVGRGGGSIEDLWPFNEESVARAIFACPVPVISAVGHETDITIADFVADMRAATPTQSVILSTPDINELRQWSDGQREWMHLFMEQKLHRNREKVERLLRSYAFKALQQRLVLATQLLSQTGMRMHHAQERRLIQLKNSVEACSAKIAAHNPSLPMKRGYAKVMQNGVAISRKSHYTPGLPLDIHWLDGEIRV